MTDAPDSCHSWLIAAACHIIFFLVFGIVRISGLIFSASITYFGVDREHASLPFVLSNVTRALASPLTGYLGHTLGLRPVIVAGCFLCSLGVGACFFAQDILTLSIYWSIYGLGCGLSTPILPQVLNEYFQKHASKANGIAIAGAPLAGFVLPPITVALLKEYGVAGSFLNLSAILLHSVPAAMLLAKPRFKITDSNQKTSTNISSNIHCDEKHKKNIETNEKKCFNSQKVVYSLPSEKAPASLETKAKSFKVIMQIDKSDENIHEKPLEDILKPVMEPSSQPTSSENKGQDSCLSLFSIFWDPVFLLLSVPKCVLLFCYVTVPMFIVDFFNDKGFSIEQSTYLLMIFAAFDLVGKSCLGFVTDSRYMSRTKFASLLYMIMAVSFVLLVFSNSFVAMNLTLALEALCTGGIAPVHPGLTAEYIDKNRQTMAMASSELLFLPLSVTSISLIGHFRDDLGSYDGLLYIFSSICVLSTLILMGLPNFSSWWKNRKAVSNPEKD